VGVFAIRIEHPLDMTIERLHDPDLGPQSTAAHGFLLGNDLFYDGRRGSDGILAELRWVHPNQGVRCSEAFNQALLSPAAEEALGCHPALQAAVHGSVLAAPQIAPHTPLRDGLAERFVSHGGYSWVPLVRGEAALYCSIEILMLRMDLPGGNIRSPDLDNRAKLLIDAMTIPNMSISHQDLGGLPQKTRSRSTFFLRTTSG